MMRVRFLLRVFKEEYIMNFDFRIIFIDIWMIFSCYRMIDNREKKDICGVVMWATCYLVASITNCFMILEKIINF